MDSRISETASYRLSESTPATDPAAALELLTRPKRAQAGPDEQALLERAERMVVRSAGRRLAAWAWGAQGPRILLVHGWDSRASHYASYIEALFRAGYSVVAFDAPAHGDSEGFTSNVVDIGRSVLDVAERMGGFDAVIGHSVGSPACLFAFANGFYVSASIHLAGPSSLKRVLASFGALCRMQGDRVIALQDMMAARIGAPLDVMELECLAEGLRHPALLLHDPKDQEVPFSESEALHAVWSRSVLQPVRGVGHRRIVREDAVIAASLRFLAQQLSIQTA